MNLLNSYFLFLMTTISQGVISFLMVPVITYVLGPKDIGVYAFVNSFTTIIITIATLGNNFVFAQFYRSADKNEKQKIVSTALFVSFIVSIGCAILLFVIWPYLGGSKGFVNIPKQGFYFAVATMLISIPYVIAMELLPLRGAALHFAVMTISQIISNSIIMILSLYVWHLHQLALFTAPFGSMAVGSLIALFFLREEMCFILNKIYMKKILSMGIFSLLSDLTDNIQIIIERSVLAKYVGVGRLGLYMHAQQYMNILSLTMKATVRTIWPVSLDEARQNNTQFPKTREAWDITYFFIAMSGMLFACIGKEIIHILTYGKFDEAFVYVVFLIMLVLVKNMGRPQMAMLYAKGKGFYYSISRFFSILAGMGFMVYLVPKYGVLGAIGGLFVQEILFRLLLQLLAKLIQDISFQDQIAIFGIILMLSLLGFTYYFELNIWMRLMIFMGHLLVLILVMKNKLIKFSRNFFSIRHVNYR